MKKFILYIIFFISLFLISNNVFALEQNFVISRSETSFLDFSDYEGISCNASGLRYLKFVQVSNEKGTVSYAGTDFPDEPGYTESMTCTYTDIISQTGKTSGYLTFNFAFESVMRNRVNFSLIKGKLSSYDFFGYYGDTDTRFLTDIASIVSFEANSNKERKANSYFSFDCPANSTNKCTVTVGDSFPESKTQGLIANYILKYVSTSGMQVITEVDITAYPSLYITANPGGIGTCDFDSSWTAADGTSKKHKLVVGDNVTLPNCNNSNTTNPLLKFEGWIDVSQYPTLDANISRNNLCVEYVNISPNSSIMMSDNLTSFVGCYSSDNGLILELNGGEFRLGSGAITLDGKAYIKTSSAYSLPNVTKIPEIYNVYKDATFVGWQDEAGNIVAPGTSVQPHGQTYFAKFSNSSVSQENTYSKVIYVDEPDNIGSRSGKTMKTCTSSDLNYVETVISGNQCILYGNMPTAEGQYVNVFVTYQDDSSEAYKVRIEQSESQAGGDGGSINLDGNEDFGVQTEIGDEVVYSGVTTCNTYTLYSSGIGVSGIAYHNGNRLGVTEYRARSTCDSSIVHLALCMDPGRGGPNNGEYTYYLDESFDPNNEFGKLIRHIVKKLVEKGVDKNDTSPANTHIIAAANIALRVVQYYSIDELASDASPRYASNVAAYKGLGDSLKAKCGGNLERCDDSTISTALDAWSWQSGFADVKNNVVEFLSSYETVEDAEELSGITGSSRILSMNPYGDGAIIYVEGTIEFDDPNQMQNYTMTTDCPGFTCNLVSNYKDTASHTWTYKMAWYITPENAQAISTLKAGEKPAVVLTDAGGNRASNVFVLKPAASNLQRMVIFNTESSKIRIEVDTNACISLKPLYEANEEDPNIPAIVRPNSPRFNPTIFKELGCCRAVPESSETYETYCTQYCYTSNFSLYCDPNSTGNTNGTMVDTYSLKEGYVGGISDGNKFFSCVVDVTNDVQTGITNTNKKVDFAGNKYLVYKNKYCGISCREEWDVSLPSFDSFIDDKAVIAGMYFVMNKNIFIGTKRQCYTTYMDYSTYVTDQQTLADQIMNEHGIHSEFTRVYSNMKANLGSESVTYNTYYHNSSEDYKCHDRDGDGEGSRSADGCAEYEEYEVSCNCSRNADGSRSCDTCTRRRCVAANPCYHTCHVWYSESHNCTLYTVGNTSTPFKYYDQKNIQRDGVGDQMVTSVDAGDKSANTSAHNISDSSYAVDDSGSTLKSHYERGNMPAPTDHYEGDNNGKCCGAETFNCGGTVADHDYIIDKATYSSPTFGYSGNVKNTIRIKANSVKSKTQTLNNNAKYMAACQNYYLNNDTTDPAYNYNLSATEVSDNYSGITGGKLFQNTNILTTTVEGQKVSTKFEPKASYKYEEIFFMNELSKDSKSNIIQIFKEENNSKGASDGRCVNIDRTDQAGRTLKLCRSGKEVFAYNPNQNDPWKNEIQGKTYSGSGDTTLAGAKDSFHIPVCKTLDPTSYEYNDSHGANFCETATSPIYKIHYLSKTLANSSYFRNKGHWYIDSVTDVKSHGDTKAVAVSNNSSSMVLLTTNLYGAKYNTFPVALDTPKNIYQYSYSFKDIGMFPNGTPGRIMGDPVKSMVSNNTRNCFYEVIEELCTCCGDPILFYSYETSRIDDTNGYLDGKGYPFDPSRTDYDRRSSVLNILNSTVSLYDPSGGDGDIAGNWSSTDQFVYEGNIYTTNKGAELYNAIMEKGELIYDTSSNTPEYSYTLNPSLMSTIRSYNGSHRYGYSRSTIRIVGNKICFNTSGSCSDSDENSGYFHFASKFLEESYMIDAITPAYRGNVNTSKTGAASACSVTDATNVYQGAYNNCRWIDYVENVGGKSIKLALK